MIYYGFCPVSWLFHLEYYHLKFISVVANYRSFSLREHEWYSLSPALCWHLQNTPYSSLWLWFSSHNILISLSIHFLQMIWFVSSGWIIVCTCLGFSSHTGRCWEWLQGCVIVNRPQQTWRPSLVLLFALFLSSKFFFFMSLFLGPYCLWCVCVFSHEFESVALLIFMNKVFKCWIEHCEWTF